MYHAVLLDKYHPIPVPLLNIQVSVLTAILMSSRAAEHIIVCCNHAVKVDMITGDPMLVSTLRDDPMQIEYIDQMIQHSV